MLDSVYASKEKKKRRELKGIELYEFSRKRGVREDSEIYDLKNRRMNLQNYGRIQFVGKFLSIINKSFQRLLNIHMRTSRGT